MRYSHNMPQIGMQLIVRQRSLSHCPISPDRNGSWDRCLAFTTVYPLPEPGSKCRIYKFTRILRETRENLLMRHLQVLCSRSSWCQLNGFNSWLLARMRHRHSYVSVVVQAGKGADPRDKWHIWLDCFLTVVTIITQMGNYSPQWFAAESALRFDLQAFCWWRHVLNWRLTWFFLRRYWKRLNSQPCPGSNHSMVHTSCLLNPCGWDWSSSCWNWGVTVRLLQTQHMMSCQKLQVGLQTGMEENAWCWKPILMRALMLCGRATGSAFLAKAARRWWRGRCGRCIVGWWCDKSELGQVPGILVGWLQGCRVGIIDTNWMKDI